MNLLRRSRSQTPPKVSFILLDWSCRESFHMLDYLAEQSVPRDQYEIVWIEYYDRQPVELTQRLEAAAAAGKPEPIDTHVLLEMPRSAYYHKHLMYNVGIVLAAGEIVCICDSDTMVSRDFVESILKEFEADPELVLHHDEVRHPSRDLHPFRYPPFEEVRGPGSTTVVNRRSLGIWDEVDPLHTRNYGACLSARRADLIAIGGADMHIDYLGHVCGPYEMTFRLVNAGKREYWHRDEYLYHTWHPGEAGDNNYFGPHDGLSMSTTALAARKTGRVMPLDEHPAIERLRTQPQTPESELLALTIDAGRLESWNIERLNTEVQSRDVTWGQIRMRQSAANQAANTPAAPTVRPRRPFSTPPSLWAKLVVMPVLVHLFYSQWRSWRHLPLPANEKLPADPTLPSWKQPLQAIRDLKAFILRMWVYNRHLVKQCWLHLCCLAETGSREVILYGEGDAARLLYTLSRLSPVRVTAICPIDGDHFAGWRGVKTCSPDQLRESNQQVIVGLFANVDRHASRLERLGVSRDRLVLMQ